MSVCFAPRTGSIPRMHETARRGTAVAVAIALLVAGSASAAEPKEERIAEVEQLTVTEDDIRALAEEDARKTGLEVAKLLPYYTDSSRVKERLMTDKVMAFLIQHATITEKETSGT